MDQMTDELLSPHDKAIRRFLCSADECKTCKLKLIPKIVEGNMLVKKLVTGKPVIIGNKLPISTAATFFPHHQFLYKCIKPR